MSELQRQGSPNIVIALAGNKSDLASKRTVPTATAQEYADANNCLFMETSAKTNENVSELFVEIAKKLPKTQAPKAAVHSTLSLQATVPEDDVNQNGSKCKC